MVVGISRPRRPRHDLWRAREGATALEFALVAPVLFTILFGVVEFSRLMWTQSALHFAVEAAARCASVTPGVCGTSAQIQTYAAAEVSALNIPASAFTPSAPACGHQVIAAFGFQFVASGLFPFTPTLTAQACFA
jgi:Flp pilus assembly protein TadG